MKHWYFIFSLFLTACNQQPTEDEKVEPLYTYDVEQRISDLGIQLTEPKLPEGLPIYLATRSNNLVYLSGIGPIDSKGFKTIGKVGSELTVEQGNAAARLTAINHLSVLKAEIGDLNKVVRIVKVFGMVNADSSFTEHPQVINGYSNLMMEVFGERGKHARTAVGVASLPWNIACEVEAIVEIRE